MFSQVREFHNVFDIVRPLVPTIPTADLRDLRIRLLQEEHGELDDAKSLIDVADALADMAYIACGTLISYGTAPEDGDWFPSPLPSSNAIPAWPSLEERKTTFAKLDTAMSLYLATEMAGDQHTVAITIRNVLGEIWLASLIYGIPLQAVFDEVHASNMTKLGNDGKPVRRADGKVIKGPNYRKPDIAAVLLRFGWAR